MSIMSMDSIGTLPKRMGEYVNYNVAKNIAGGIVVAAGVVAAVGVGYVGVGQWMTRRSSNWVKRKCTQRKSNGGNIVVVGGGIIGCALAVTLARQGKKVTLIERDWEEQDRIIGELLQPGGYDMLCRLGLEHCVEGIDASIIRGYGVFLKGEKVGLLYPSWKDGLIPEWREGEAPTGRGIHYGRFLQKLRETVKNEKNITPIVGVVRAMIEKDDQVLGVKYVENNQEKTILADLTFACNGAGSVFTKKISGTKSLSRSTFVGVRMKCRNEDLPFPYRGNVFLSTPGPCLIYPTSNQDVRVLVDFPKGTMPKRSEMSKFLLNNTASQFPEPVRSHFIAAVKEGDIRSVPNREMPADQSKKVGIVLLGDALTMRHPLTGSGMSAGLTDVWIISECLKNSNIANHDQVEEALQKWWKQRNSKMATINILANALYSVFTPAVTTDPYVHLLQSACFDYFKLGGICQKHPVGLLGVIVKSPYVLIAHYFGVAFLTIKQGIWPYPTPKSIYATYRAIKCACGIVFPLMAEERILKLALPYGFWNREELRN